MDLAKWYNARGIFFGLSWERDMEKGLLLAAASNHPDAIWFCSVFPNGPPPTIEEAAVTLRNQTDPRALCLTVCATSYINFVEHYRSPSEYDLNTLRRSTDVLAQAWLIVLTRPLDVESAKSCRQRALLV